MNLRRKLLAFLQSQKKTAEYTELEYLESDGNQYINLGIAPNDTTGVKIKFYVNSADGKNYVIGSRGAGVGRFYAYSTEGSPTDVKYGWGNIWTNTGITPVVGTPVEASLNYFNDRKYIYNGTEVNSNLPQSSFSGNTYDMYLFSSNFANVFYNDAILNGGIYYCQITQGDKVIMDLIPVLDKDLVPCMYDKVSGRFLYNQGTGEFKWKLPNQLEYLESTGTQYINTGFLSKDLYDKSLYIKMKTTGGTSSYAYNGAFHISGTGLTNQFGLLATSNTLCRTTQNHFDPSNLAVTNLQKSEFTELMMTPTEYWVNGEFKANHEQTSVDKILETNNPFLIFGRSQYNQPNSITPMIISEFWIKDKDGNYVQYLIPVFDENLTPCMYDLVSKTYLYNQGTGQFKGFFEDGSQLVSYLESTGTQYINMGIFGTENISIRTSFEFTTKDVQYLFGSSVTYNTDTFCFSLNSANTGKIYRAFIGAITGTLGNTEEVFSTKMSVNNAYFSTTQIRLDDEVYDFTSVTPFTTPTPMFLFAKSNNGTAAYFTKAKVKFFKIYDNDVLVQNLVPVLKSGNTACMYDLVSKKYFVNAGTGTFNYGEIE